MLFLGEKAGRVLLGCLCLPGWPNWKPKALANIFGLRWFCWWNYVQGWVLRNIHQMFSIFLLFHQSNSARSTSSRSSKFLWVVPLDSLACFMMVWRRWFQPFKCQQVDEERVVRRLVWFKSNLEITVILFNAFLHQCTYIDRDKYMYCTLKIKLINHVWWNHVI